MQVQISLEIFSNYSLTKVLFHNFMQFIFFTCWWFVYLLIFQFHVSYKDLDSYTSKKLSGDENLFLITEDDQHLADGHRASVLFVLLIIVAKKISSTKIPSKFIPLLSQSFSGKTYCLLKKVSNIWNKFEVFHQRIVFH